MSEIRDRLIEALMDENPRWDHIRAGEVLDRCLAVLSEHADEWTDAVPKLDAWRPTRRNAEQLLAVLADPEETP